MRLGKVLKHTFIAAEDAVHDGHEQEGEAREKARCSICSTW
jgi:hypothetical protein